MSIDGWIWACERRPMFKNPLEMLVALTIGDSGGLQRFETDRTCPLSFEWLANQCRCSPQEAADAVRAVAAATGAELFMSGEAFSLRVAEFAKPASFRQYRDPKVAMRDQFDAMRNKLVQEGILEGPCRACGAPSEVIDHDVPIARGGTNERENLQPLCAFCNNTKKTKTMAEFMAWRERVAGTA